MLKDPDSGIISEEDMIEKFINRNLYSGSGQSNWYQSSLPTINNRKMWGKFETVCSRPLDKKLQGSWSLKGGNK